MNTPTVLRAFCGTLLALLLPIAAQALEFRVLSWSGALNDLHLSTGRDAQTIPLVAGEDALSAPYRVQSTDVLRLFAIPVTDESVVEPVATLSVPKNLERAILVLAPNPGAGDAYVGLWIDDSLESRPDNSVTLHNLASMPVALRLGATEVLLQPRESHAQVFGATERSLMIQAAIPRGSKWERVTSSPQPVRKGVRILIILRDGRRLADGSMSAVDKVTLYDYNRPDRKS